MAFTRRSLLKLGATVGGLAAYGGIAHHLLQDDRWEPNESYWFLDRASEPQPPAKGKLDVDVAVIGGGFTGLSAAFHVKQRFPDLRVALFEAKQLGFGASGRCGGLLVEGLGRPGGNVRFAKRFIEAHGLKCERNKNHVNPNMLVVALGALCRRTGVQIYENTKIREVVPDKPARLEGDGFRVAADTIILGTNAYTPRLGFLRRRLFPLHTGTIVSAPLGDKVDSLPPDFVRRIRGGTDYYWGRTLPDQRLLFGGGIRYAYDNGLAFSGAPHLYDALDRAMRRTFPVVGDTNVTHRWSGPMAFFFDSQARIGTVGDHENIHYALGYAGNGIAKALHFGHLLAELINGTPPPAATTAPAQWLPGEPLRYSAINAALHLVDFGLVDL